jgi:hypothetical protein
MIRTDFNILSPLQYGPTAATLSMRRRFSVRSLFRAGSSPRRQRTPVFPEVRLPDFPFAVRSTRLLSDADVGDGVEQSKYIAEPPQDTNDNDYIQNRLDGTGHWDEAVDQPQDYADDDQSEQYLKQRHDL